MNPDAKINVAGHRELAELIAGIVGYTGELAINVSKPDGTPRKLLDIARITSQGWKPSTPLCKGLELTCADFLGRGKHAPPEQSMVSSGSGLRQAQCGHPAAGKAST